MVIAGTDSWDAQNVELLAHVLHELEEIDLAVQSIPDVQRAVAVVLSGSDGGEIAVAYMANRSVAAEEVLRFCKERLLAYMRPVQVVQFDELPRNANGKVDRRAAKALLEQADKR